MVKTIDPIDLYNYLTRRQARAERDMFAARKRGDQLLANYYRGKVGEAYLIRKYWWSKNKK